MIRLTYKPSPDCVLGTIEARGSHEPGVAEAGCMAVRNFFLTAPVDETASEELLPRALSIVSDVAIAHGEDLGTLEQALAALRAILHHKASLASRLEGNFVSVITSDSQTGLRPMACGNRNVVYHCVSLLGSVLRGASSIRDEYVNNTVSGGLVDFIMDATADDPDAQCQMEAAMGLVSGGLVDFIMDANDDDPDAQCQMEAAMDLLCFLSGSSYKSRMALLDKGLSKATSIIKAVVKAMEKHPQSAPIQGCGCMVFYNIALDNKLRTDICEGRGGRPGRLLAEHTRRRCPARHEGASGAVKLDGRRPGGHPEDDRLGQHHHQRHEEAPPRPMRAGGGGVRPLGPLGDEGQCAQLGDRRP
ncbi:hypothetical protein THAOC_22970 [Thalassiosira oceanica]|uniref:Uncharacterized protein n=1 Tax=Thalassiosira oceanica TaxID=159749 RepID=K0S801_THAOC|nr:hypothetical protein THAOC_22970 [Thalassiosira oceanica]|eukprot:EJK57031.1 hypothetical protein THAOC_22970 [Thalassiosira oceanica]